MVIDSLNHQSYISEEAHALLLNKYKKGTLAPTPKEKVIINPNIAYAVTEEDIIKSIPYSWIKSNSEIYGELTKLSIQDPVKNTPWDFLYFVNPDVFRPAAIAFERSERAVKGTGIQPSYCPYLKGTTGYRDYWKEEFRRIKKGYEPIVDGKPCGIRIPGEFYFYLNYCRIMNAQRLPTGEEIDVEGFPDFLTMDYYYFKELEARENPHLFNLPIDYKRSIVLVKGRRLGFSYKAAAGCIWIAAFNNKARVGVASEPNSKDATDAVKCVRKCIPILDHLTKCTPFGRTDPGDPKTNGGWKHENLSNTNDYVSIKLGIVNTKTKEKRGRQSEIFTMSLSKDDAASGEGLNRLYFEEGGKTANLDKAWTFSRETMKAGSIFRGIAIVYGCVCAGTKVWTNDGRIVNIEDLKKEDGIIGYDGNKATPQTINWFKPPAKKKCYKITTTGTTIECSEDHPFVMTRRGLIKRYEGEKLRRVTYEQAKDLKVKDQLLIPNSVPFFGNKNIKQARIIGLLIGDGCCKRSIQFGSCEEEVFKYVTSNVKSYKENISKDFITKDGRAYKQITIYDNILKRTLIDGDIWERVKDDKRLPSNIHEYNKDSLAELIGGYFDADGSIKYDNKKDAYVIVLTSVVYELLEQVKYQLLKFGIHCNIVKENRDETAKISEGQKDHIYRLYITKSQDVRAFKNNIKFVCNHKQSLLDSISDEWFDKKRLFGYIDKAIFVDNPNVDKENYMSEIMENVRYETVVSIEEIGEKEVYNLNCSSHHTYLANSLITRQTGGEMKSSNNSAGSTRAFSQLFYKPRPYELAEFDNIYEYKDKVGEKCGYFVSSLWARFGDEIPIEGKKYKSIHNGNAFFWVAELCINKDRKEKKEAGAEEYNRFLTQISKTPSESFLISTGSVFNVPDLLNLHSDIKNSPGGFAKFRIPGYLIENADGKIVFQPDMDGKLQPITTMYSDITNKEGCLLVYEEPLRIDDKVPDDAYVISCDPIGNESKSGKSFNAIIVIKTPKYENILGPSTVVATYFGRPEVDPLGKLYELLRRLSIFYNAKITYENDRDGGILLHYSHKNWLNYLMRFPKQVISRDISPNSATLQRMYGHSMATDRHKEFGELYTNRWLVKKYSNYKGLDINNNVVEIEGKRSLDLLRDELLIEQLIDYDREGNYDMVLALMGAMVQFADKFSEEKLNNTYSTEEISKRVVDFYMNRYKS